MTWYRRTATTFYLLLYRGSTLGIAAILNIIMRTLAEVAGLT